MSKYGFSTGSEFITLPLIAESVRGLFSKDNGYAKKPEERADGEAIESYCEVLVPIAYTFPLLGAFAPFLFILFVAWLYKSPLDLWEQIRLIVVGIPSFFGSSKISVISLLSLMHLPSDAYNIYISSGILRQCFIASLSSISIFSFSTISIALLTNRCRLEWKRVITSFGFILLLVILVIGGLQMGFSYMLSNTYHGNDLISDLSFPLDSRWQ